MIGRRPIVILRGGAAESAESLLFQFRLLVGRRTTVVTAARYWLAATGWTRCTTWPADWLIASCNEAMNPRLVFVAPLTNLI